MTDPIRGEFEVFTEPTGQRFERYNAIATAHREAVQVLSRLYVPYISPTPTPDQFRDVADFLIRWAQIADRVLKLVGEEAQSNTSETLDMNIFDGHFLGAVEGNATFELERCAAAVEAEEEYGDFYADNEYEERLADAGE
jgi:hypothetical protein